MGIPDKLHGLEESMGSNKAAEQDFSILLAAISCLHFSMKEPKQLVSVKVDSVCFLLITNNCTIC